MCGRYGLATTGDALADLLELLQVPSLPPRFNIAPTQRAPVVRLGPDGQRRLDALSWGLIPGWAKDRRIASRLINARSETVHEKPSFRAAFQRRRCLVPADGWYEWRTQGRAKAPFNIGLLGGAPFAMAGLWERWTPPETGPNGEPAEPVETFTILTRAAIPRLAPIHDRMPVLVAPSQMSLWLDPAVPPRAALEPVFGAWPPQSFALWAVGDRVGSVRHDGPDLRAPRPTQGGLL